MCKDVYNCKLLRYSMTQKSRVFECILGKCLSNNFPFGQAALWLTTSTSMLHSLIPRMTNSPWTFKWALVPHGDVVQGTAKQRHLGSKLRLTQETPAQDLKSALPHPECLFNYSPCSNHTVVEGFLSLGIRVGITFHYRRSEWKSSVSDNVRVNLNCLCGAIKTGGCWHLNVSALLRRQPLSQLNLANKARACKCCRISSRSGCPCLNIREYPSCINNTQN